MGVLSCVFTQRKYNRLVFMMSNIHQKQLQSSKALFSPEFHGAWVVRHIVNSSN